MATRLRPVTQSHFQISINGDPSRTFFTKFSGLSEKRQTSTYPDGQKRRLYKVAGMTEADDITIGCPYDPEACDPLLDYLEKLRDSGETAQITVSPINDSSDPTPRGPGFQFEGCQIVGVKVLEADRSSNNVAMLEATFAYVEYRRG
jgi:hypothetical protein